MNRDEWWAVLWATMAFVLSIVAFQENRRADHWQAEYDIARHAAFAWKDSYMELRGEMGEMGEVCW